MENDPVIQTVADLVKGIHEDLDYAPGMVTKAVIVAEVLFEDDGGRKLLFVRDKEIMDWEVQGMFTQLLSDLTANTVVDWLTDD